MAQASVSHSGKVIAIDPDFITVEIISEAACAGCHAASLCDLTNQKTKQVVVSTPVSEWYEVGEEVWVDLRASMGHKAVWIAYVGPLLVMLAVILGLFAAGVSELVAGLSGLGAVVLYYLVIALLKDRLQDQYVFKIRKKNP